MTGFIGLATLGRTPRPDFQQTFAPHLEATASRMIGALDGVDDHAALALHEPFGEYPIHIPVGRDAGIDVPRNQIRPYLQKTIDSLEEQGASAIAILCAGDLGEYRCSVPLMTAGKLVPHLIKATLGTDKALGVITPNKGQVPYASEKWKADGFDAHVIDVPPYTQAADRRTRLLDGCRQLKDANAAAIVLDCFGFSAADGQHVYRELGMPVFVAREIAARATGVFALYLAPGA